MGKIKICDCTLSWGGAVINWDFGAVRIPLMEKLVRSNADIVELGILCGRQYRQNHVDYYSTALVQSTPSKGASRFALSVDTWESPSLQYVEPATESCIDIFKVHLWKGRFKDGFRCCEELLEKGYQICVVLEDCAEYYQSEFISALGEIKALEPYAIYVGDCYGRLDAEQTLSYIEWADAVLPQQVALGYRGADTLGQVVTVARMICSRDFARDCLLDGSIHGFAPQAGTLAIESVVDILSAHGDACYDRKKQNEAYEECLKKIEPVVKYGYQILYERVAMSGYAPEYGFFEKYVMGMTEEEILQSLPFIPEEGRLHFSKEIAKNSVQRYRENYWTGKLCVVVPTANRSKDIAFYLETIAKCHEELGIDLIIYDSSSDDLTEKIVNRYQCFGNEHLRYYRYKGKFDGVSLDDKVISAYNEFLLQYQYLWVVRDGLIANIGVLYNRLYQRMDAGIDLFSIYSSDQDWEKLGDKKYDQNSLSEFFRDNCRHLTILGCAIVSSTFIKSVLEKVPLDKKKNYGMWQPISFFQYLPGHAFQAENIIEEAFILNKHNTPFSFWNKSGRALWQWGERWYTMISELPSEYNEEKSTVLKIEMTDFHPFHPRQLITMRASGSLSFKKWKEYKQYLEHVTDISKWKFMCACCIPRWICKTVRRHETALFSKVAKKCKNLLVRAYHLIQPRVTPAPIPLIETWTPPKDMSPVRFNAKQLCIVIPTANRAEILEEVLRSSIGQYSQYGINVIIIDSSKDDATEAKVQQFIADGFENIAYYRYTEQDDPKSLDKKVIFAYKLACQEYEYIWMMRDRLMASMEHCAFGIKKSILNQNDFISIHNSQDDYHQVGEKTYSNVSEFFREQCVSMSVLGNTIVRGNTISRIIDQIPLDEKTNYGLWQPIAFFQYFATHPINAVSLSGDIFFYHSTALKPSFWINQLLWQWGERWYDMLHELPSEIYGAEKSSIIREWYARYLLLSVPYLLSARTKNALSVSDIKQNESYLPYVSVVPIKTFYKIARYPRWVAVLATKTYGRKIWRKIRDSYDDSLFGQID